MPELDKNVLHGLPRGSDTVTVERIAKGVSARVAGRLDDEAAAR